MASGHKRKPTLPAIPIPPNPLATKPSPHATVYNNVSSPLLPKSMSDSRKLPEGGDLSRVDPDDLFIRFTIPEIKTIQLKLRADADAKQEELRLMVGERYRDLLQASTSIISIADSSHHVMSALAEMREAMAPQRQHKPRSSSIRGKDDAHLKVLQSLSAHLKLLLDAPEHLWRLLEKKEHLQAAWLFLLTRVVHRALVTEDLEEGSWGNEGINVVAQFPLVQRQWDTVAQFRPQIAHRATQYLREPSISSENACSTVLTLHLLDSLPLTETLTTLLSQRSRTLNTLFSRNLELRTPSRPGSPILTNSRRRRMATGLPSTPPSDISHPRIRRDVVCNVREAVIELLDVIWGTLHVARDLFHPMGHSGRGKSVVERSLEDIQSDTPSGLVLTTPTLLSTLPSSTHLLTLPHSILSYKPYIDLTSPSSHVDPVALDSKLSAWFDKALVGLEGRVHVWFAGLENIREVWGLRRKVLEKLQTSHGLDEREKMKVRGVLDSSVKGRISEVASAALGALEGELVNTLKNAIQDIREGMEDSQLDTSPSTFVFSAPPLPSLSQLSTNQDPAASPFKVFKYALRQRVEGRTPFLSRVLGEVENKAQEITENLGVMDEGDDESRDLRDQIMTLYHHAVLASTSRIYQDLERIMTKEVANADRNPVQSVNVIIFVGRLCYCMSSSPCISSLCPQSETMQAFHDVLSSLHERSLDYWRDYVVSKALEECKTMFSSITHVTPSAEFIWPSQPSPQLTNAILCIISSLGHLGLSRAQLIVKGVVKKVVQEFQSALAAGISSGGHPSQREQVQILWDLTFLQRFPQADSAEIASTLITKLSHLWQQLQSVTPEEKFSQLQAHINNSIDLYLPRSQTLIAPLQSTLSAIQKSHANGNAAAAEHVTTTSRAKPTALLPFGAPEADQEYRPAVETVKPSARFGLLLVGSTSVR